MHSKGELGCPDLSPAGSIQQVQKKEGLMQPNLSPAGSIQAEWANEKPTQQVYWCCLVHKRSAGHLLTNLLVNYLSTILFKQICIETYLDCKSRKDCFLHPPLRKLVLPKSVQVVVQEPTPDAVPLEEACTSLQMQHPVSDMRQIATRHIQGQRMTGQPKRCDGHVTLSSHTICCCVPFLVT